MVLQLSLRVLTRARARALALALALALAPSVRAQTAAAAERLARWVALDAPTGHEHLATDGLLEHLPGWERDRSGSLLRRVGSGAPRRVVACGLDQHAYAISRITEDGYLRLHRVGAGTGHVLWDQSHEGQQLRILTANGPVLGVSAIPNGHFAFQHRNETAVVTADDLWLDVGAESAAEVGELGIGLLDPVVRHLPPWSYADELAGPGAGARVGCAAVVAASSSEVSSGETLFVLSTQHVFGWVGASAVVARLGSVDTLVLVGPGEATRRDETVDIGFNRRMAPVLERAGVATVRWIAPRVQDPGALMERISTAEADSLRAKVAEAAGTLELASSWVEAPEPTPLEWRSGTLPSGRNVEGEVASLLERLVEAPAVPGHEAPVRAIVVESMPAWARERAQIDALGNVWVEMGPETDATVFIAHMDEVGFEVEAIAPDGTLSLRRRGGPVSSAWEGQPAVLQLDSEASPVRELRGVFLTRQEPDRKSPDVLRAWLGLDATALAERGVRAGLGVTGYKEGHRLGAHRFTARALDDRAGTTALLLALRRIDPETLERRVIFAWSVQEEGGLVGAAALAERFGLNARRVFSVDTFVSSDTPLESPHFAYAPLGNGPVLRAVENSSMAPPPERERIPELASAAGVRVQLGLTQGGTDGTTFTFWGAPNAGLSWPGRYSHSPAEVLDLRDLAELPNLILAVATLED